jgi:hypothetical protein
MTVPRWRHRIGAGSSATAGVRPRYTEPGLYDVSFEIESGYGPLTSTKANYIHVMADTLTFTSDSAYANEPIDIVLSLANTQPVEVIRLAFGFRNHTFDLQIDSVSFGSRTAGWERIRYVSWDESSHLYDMELIADNGGGTPPLPVGSGDVFHIWVTPDTMAIGGMVNIVDTATVELVPFRLEATEITYVPRVIAGEVSTRYTLRGDLNFDTFRDISDILMLARYALLGGEPPRTHHQADVDDDGFIDISDVLYLARYSLLGGAPPVEP